MELFDLTAAGLGALINKGEISAKEAAAAYLNRIAREDASIGAYLTVTAELALAQAERVDKKRAAGEKLSPLSGVPMGIKDNMCTQGVRTSCASKMLGNYIPPYDAHAVSLLQRRDAVMLGKMNMDEFAMGSTTENSHFHPTKNPRDISRVPGGSSGGSAAAVAAHLAAYTLGSDTGGSIRQPAAFCGVVGMKPTYGSVSRYGLIAFASSLDQIGPLTRDVRDNALVLNAIAGHDGRDATSVNRLAEDYTRLIGRDIRDMKIALPKEYFGKGISPWVKEGVYAAARGFERLGAEIIEVSMQTIDYALPAYYVISGAEASSNLARFDGIKYGFCAKGCEDVEEIYLKSRSEGFGPEVKRRIMLGSFALSAGYYDAYYKKALQVRTLIVQDFNRIFKECDIVLSPVAPTTAYKLGEKADDPLKMYLGDVYTVPVNIAGLPALALPCGGDDRGLPIGMQLIGRPFDEARLYQAAYAFEQGV